MKWTEELFGTKKAIIGLVHMSALPGDPYYDTVGGMEAVLERTRADVLALQEGGVDGLLFTNEYSVPYQSHFEFSQIAAMAYVMGALKDTINLPFGADCIGDELASIELASATGAAFTRGIFHGTWATSEGIQLGKGAEAVRLRKKLDIEKFRLVYYITPEGGADFGGRDPIDIMKSIYFLNKPDGIAVAGYVAGQKPDAKVLQRCREAFPESVLFAATGVKIENCREYLENTDGAFIGTTFKKDGNFWNGVDQQRVKAFMDKVNSFRNLPTDY